MTMTSRIPPPRGSLRLIRAHKVCRCAKCKSFSGTLHGELFELCCYLTNNFDAGSSKPLPRDKSTYVSPTIVLSAPASRGLVKYYFYFFLFFLMRSTRLKNAFSFRSSNYLAIKLDYF